MRFCRPWPQRGERAFIALPEMQTPHTIDGIHLNAAGYLAWEEAVLKALSRICGTRSSNPLSAPSLGQPFAIAILSQSSLSHDDDKQPQHHAAGQHLRGTLFILRSLRLRFVLPS